MASDISKIIKSEISSTLESLLSVTSKIEEVELLNATEFTEQQCIKVEANFEFSDKSSHWDYFIPTQSSTQFEYLMLGGAIDLKDALDDETKDAVQEIVSTISGSIVTSTNAQSFGDLSGVKFTLGQSSIIQCSQIESTQKAYKFVFSLNDDKFDLIIAFDDTMLVFLNGLTGASDTSSDPSNSDAVQSSGPQGSILNSLLGEESVDNLRLLFDIKMRLSVRLGTKVCLLRDVISWDIGEIIELTQMTNEPLDILVNGVVIGKGEAIIVDGKFGVKIKSIGLKKIN